MADLDSYRRRFRYHAWAMRTLTDVAAGPALRPLAHALTADRVWLIRLGGGPTGHVALWPDLDAAACRALARHNAEAIEVFPLEADLDATASYRNSSGRTYTTAVRDVLDHVLLHAAHHRGQANAALRAAGGAPPHVDFIAWVRAGEPS